MTKIVLSNDTFRGKLKVYLQTNRAGAMDLIGTYQQNLTGDWGAELGDGETFHAATKSALREKIRAALN
jgi:hypothetical protein